MTTPITTTTATPDTTLQDLASTLQTQAEKGPVSLVDDSLFGGRVAPLARAVLGDAPLSVSHGLVAAGEAQVTLTGTASLLGFADVLVTARFYLAGPDLALELACDFGAGSGLSVPGADWLSVGDLRLGASVPGSPERITGTLGATFRAGEHALPLRLTLPSGPGWSFSFAGDPLPFGSLAELGALVGGADLAGALPAEVASALGAVELYDLQLQLDSGNALRAVGLGIRSPATWSLVPDALSVGDMALSLRASWPDGGGGPTLSARIAGTVEIGEVGLPIEVRRDASGLCTLSARMTGLDAGGIADLVRLCGGDAASALPAGMEGSGGVAVDDLTLVVDPARGFVPSFSAAVRAAGTWTIVPDRLAVGDLSLSLRVAQSAPAAPREVTGSASGTVTVGGVPVTVGCVRDDTHPEWTFTGAAGTIPVTAAIEQLLPAGTTLPDAVPEVTLEGCTFSATPATGAFGFAGSAPARWEVGEVAQVDATLAASFSRAAAVPGQPAPGIDCTLSLTATGNLPVTEGLDFHDLDFRFAHGADGSWEVSGGVGATVLDRAFTLAAGYRQDATSRVFRLAGTLADGEELVSFPGGALGLSALAVQVQRPAARPGAPAAPPAWSLALAGGLRVDGALDLRGSLGAERRADGSAGLFLRPDRADVHIPLGGPALDLAMGAVSVERSAGAAGAWSFRAAATLRATGLPDPVHHVFADSVDATLVADATGAVITASRITQPFDYTLPPLDLEGTTVELGTMRVDANTLRVSLGRTTSLSARVEVGLPSRLNDLFGTRDGQPRARIFRTFDPSDPQNSTLRLQLAVSAAGVSVVPQSSPLVAVGPPVVEGGKTWWNCDLGEFGAVRLQVPEFSFRATDGSFAASGGFEVTRPLSLPLVPIRALFRACKLDALADLVPDALPLKEIRLVDEKGDFQADKLVDFLEKATNGKLPDEAVTVIDAIASRLDELPDRMKRYFDIRIPQGFLLSCAASPDGAVRLDARVPEGSEPIRLLFPSMSPPLPVPLPVLNGIELRRLSFGSLPGGTLFQLRVDAEFDQFDLASIAAALLLPDLGADAPLAPSRSLERHVVLDDLFMIIVYQTVIPIPIPVFYDRLAFEYLGLENAPVKAEIRFPQPSPSMGDVMRLLNGFKKFFTDADYLLGAADKPEQMNLVFSIPDAYLQAPGYLGGGIAGTTSGPSVDLFDKVAALLNALKTLSLDSMIRAIPIDARISSSTLSLGPVSAQGSWLISTPQEFRELGYRKLGIDPSATNEVLAMLPPVAGAHASPREQGIIALFKASWEVDDLLSLDTSFGLAASSLQGFGTGFRMRGRLADIADLAVAGSVKIHAPPTGGAGADVVFGVDGSLDLVLGGHTAATAVLHLSNDQFLLSGRVDLFPAGWPIEAKGSVDGLIAMNQFRLAGAVQTKLAGVNLLSARAYLSTDRIYLGGKWLGVDASLQVQGIGDDLRVRGTVEPSLNLKVDTGPIAVRNTKLTDGIRVGMSGTASLDTSIGKGGFSAGVSGSFTGTGVPPVSVGPFTLSVAPSDVKALAREFEQRIVQGADTFFSDLWKDASTWLKNLKSGALRWAGKFDSAVGTALRDFFRVDGPNAARFLAEAGFKAEEAATALYGTLAKNGDQLARLLRENTRYAIGEVTSGLRTVVRDASSVLGALKGGGYLAKDVAGAVKSAFGLDRNGLAGAMRKWYSAAEAAPLLVGQFANTGAKEVAAAFRSAGYPATEVAGALNRTFGSGAKEVAAAFRWAGYTADQTGDVIKEVFTRDAQAAGRALMSAGYSAEDTARVMNNKFGAAAKDVARFMKDTYGKGADQVNSILKAAGYGANTIKGVMSDMFGWFKKLDPRSWF